MNIGDIMDKIWFPLQRALRTAAAVLVTLTAVLATTTVVAPQILTAVEDVLPGSVVAWASGAIAAVAAISAALSRLMAVPWVNEQLTKIGLGTAPRGAVAVATENGPVGMTRRQFRAHLGTMHTPPDLASVTLAADPAVERAARAAVDEALTRREDGEA